MQRNAVSAARDRYGIYHEYLALVCVYCYCRTPPSKNWSRSSQPTPLIHEALFSIYTLGRLYLLL